MPLVEVTVPVLIISPVSAVIITSSCSRLLLAPFRLPPFLTPFLASSLMLLVALIFQLLVMSASVDLIVTSPMLVISPLLTTLPEASTLTLPPAAPASLLMVVTPPATVMPALLPSDILARLVMLTSPITKDLFRLAVKPEGALVLTFTSPFTV